MSSSESNSTGAYILFAQVDGETKKAKMRTVKYVLLICVYSLIS